MPTLVLFVCVFCSLYSQTRGDSWYISPKIGPYHPKIYYFPLGSSTLLRNHSTNNAMLNALDSLLHIPKVLSDLKMIEITGACSPIASEEFNKRLAANRISALKAYLEKNHPAVVRNYTIRTNVIGIDKAGERALKGSKTKLTPKQINDMLQYASIRFLMRDGSFIPESQGSPLKAIVENNQPKSKSGETFVRDTVYVYVNDTIVETQIIERPLATKKIYVDKPIYLALKSNLLYDIALLPNLTFEAYLGKNWSIAVEGNWSWWDQGGYTDDGWWHRVQAGGIELRKWFGSSRPLSGHALGIYGLAGTYDIRINPKDDSSIGWLSNWSWSAGLSYAYSFPIAKRFNLELGIAGGYLTGLYYDYNYHIDHSQWEIQAVKNRRYWGLTRAEVSIVWLLASGTNAK